MKSIFRREPSVQPKEEVPAPLLRPEPGTIEVTVYSPRAVLRGKEVVIEGTLSLTDPVHLPLLVLGLDEAIEVLGGIQEALLSRYDPVVTT
jgi:hypothetical protein